MYPQLFIYAGAETRAVGSWEDIEAMNESNEITHALDAALADVVAK